jgi:hypothetical protein
MLQAWNELKDADIGDSEDTDDDIPMSVADIEEEGLGSGRPGYLDNEAVEKVINDAVIALKAQWKEQKLPALKGKVAAIMIAIRDAASGSRREVTARGVQLRADARRRKDKVLSDIRMRQWERAQDLHWTVSHGLEVHVTEIETVTF